MAIERNTPPKALTATAWSRFKINSLEILATPAEVDDTSKPQVDVETAIVNGDGEGRYEDPDGSGSGWFAVGSEPAGWVAVTTSAKQYVKRTSYGSISGAEFFEVDSNGVEIPRTPDQKYIKPISGDELRARAAADPDYATKYTSVISALTDLANYHYDNPSL